MALDSVRSEDFFILGIDEAGRGPVLGPMIYAAAFCRESDLKRLEALGCDDSKVLSATRREELRAVLDGQPDWLHHRIREISAVEISQEMLRSSKVSLNEISHDAALGLVQDALDAGFRIRKVFVDTVGPSEPYADKFRKRFGSVLQDVVVTKKADSLYKIVSAASIFAKVRRDEVVSSRSRRDGVELGSGYPADPVTRDWLLDNVHPVFGYHDFVRFSWGTVTEILKRSAIQVDWDGEQDGDRSKKRQAFSIEQFFKNRAKSAVPSEPTPCPKRDDHSSTFLDSLGLKRVPSLF